MRRWQGCGWMQGVPYRVGLKLQFNTGEYGTHLQPDTREVLAF